MHLTKWDHRWLELAKFISQWSKDPSTKVGAVVAKGKTDLAFGYNGFPSYCPDDEDLYLDRPTKYKLVTHAEINACIKAVQKGHDIRECTVYTYPLFPCPSCSSLLAAFGITNVVSLIQCHSKSPYLKTLPDTEFILSTNNIQYRWLYE